MASLACADMSPFPFLGAMSPAVRALESSSYNCIPRVAALELQEPALGAVQYSTKEGVHALLREASGDVQIALHWSIAPNPLSDTLMLPQADLWTSLKGRRDVRAVVSAIPDALVPYVERGLEAVGRPVTFREPCRTWQPRAGSVVAVGGSALLSASIAALPAGFTLCVLVDRDAAIVDNAWKYRTQHTVDMVREAIRSRPSIGVRDSEGKLAAWAVLRADLSWGLLSTREDVRRMGLGKAVMYSAFAAQEAWAGGGALAAAAKSLVPFADATALARLTAPYVHIKTGNAASEGLFEALDFEPTGYVTWLISALPVAGEEAKVEAAASSTSSSEAVASLSTSSSASSLVGPLSTIPLSLNAPPAEWAALLYLINTSYRADDAFFVDQQRTDTATLADMARVGDFFTACDETGLLCASVYLKSTEATATDADTTPFSSDSRGQEGVKNTTTGRLPNTPSCAAPLQSTIASPVAGGSTVTISMLTISPQLKRRGLATRLLGEAEARARAQGAVALEAFVVSVKPWLIAFYEKAGFVKVGAENWPQFLEWQLKEDCYFFQVRKYLAPAPGTEDDGEGGLGSS